MKELLKKLEKNNEGCSDITLDLRYLKFSCDDEVSQITDTLSSKVYLFPRYTNYKDKESTWAIRQLCAFLGIPFEFLSENRPVVRESTINSWIEAVAPKGGTESYLLFKIKETQDIKVIRAILPVRTSTISYYDIVKSLMIYPESIPGNIRYVQGENQDSSTFVAKFMYEDSSLDPEYRPGIFISASDVSRSDMVIDFYIDHVASNTGIVSQYGNKPFATISFSDIQPQDAIDVLNTMTTRLKEEYPKFLESLKNSSTSFPGAERSCSIISKLKGIPRKFSKLLELERISCEEDMSTMRDFLRHCGFVSKSFKYPERLKIERAIGYYSGIAYIKRGK